MSRFQSFPDIFFEKALLNELNAQEQCSFFQYLDENPLAMEKYKAMQQENNAFFIKYPVQDMVLQIQNSYLFEKNKLKNQRLNKIKKTIYISFPSLAAAVFLLIILFPSIHPSKKIPDELESTRIKGLTPYLSIYQKKNSQIAILKPNDSVNLADQIQIGYISAGYPYGVIFSVDGSGSVTLHYPEDVDLPAKLETGNKEILLTSSYQLDDAPDFEKFYFITSHQPLDTKTILAQAKKTASSQTVKLGVSQPHELFLFTLKKGTDLK